MQEHQALLAAGPYTRPLLTSIGGFEHLLQCGNNDALGARKCAFTPLLYMLKPPY